jgi:CubicO group peptidase (beta-lactamase class C family)
MQPKFEQTNEVNDMQVRLSFFTVLLLSLPANPAVAQISMGLHEAVFANDLAAVQQHIEAGSNLNARDPYGSTPLIVAATFGRSDAATALIEAGTDLHIPNNDGATALHTAAFLCRVEIVRALLDHGANRYLRDNFSNTPREAVAAPFDDVKGIYDIFVQSLGPLGLTLDYEQLRATRPVIENMLKPTAEQLASVEHAPLPGRNWAVSTPVAEGLDPMLVAELYLEATGLPRLYGLLVVKNGRLIAEKYFNQGTVDQKALLQSASKSYTSALVGIALDRGCLSSVDQNMIDFFPEFADRIVDPRKKQITIRHLLQMRAGFPWEETDSTYWAALLYGDLLSPIVDFPLVSDPGAEFHYSNVSSHLLGVIVARACETDLRAFGENNLFYPMDAELGEWTRDRDGYYVGLGEMHFTARDAASFGLLYLEEGCLAGRQIVPATWVAESLQDYSERFDSGGIVNGKVGRYLVDIGYGYQWWSARAGNHRFNYAWGHGGQLIVVLDDLDMVLVVTSDPFYIQHDDESWRHERGNLNLVGKFIRSLPGE